MATCVYLMYYYCILKVYTIYCDNINIYNNNTAGAIYYDMNILNILLLLFLLEIFIFVIILLLEVCFMQIIIILILTL